eukprot:140860-Pleurochrysis_carterae.AAC.5
MQEKRVWKQGEVSAEVALLAWKGKAYEVNVPYLAIKSQCHSRKAIKEYLATPPRAVNRQHHAPVLLMTTSRIGKNSRGGNGFVKKSARLSTLRTKGTVI